MRKAQAQSAAKRSACAAGSAVEPKRSQPPQARLPYEQGERGKARGQPEEEMPHAAQPGQVVAQDAPVFNETHHRGSAEQGKKGNRSPNSTAAESLLVSLTRPAARNRLPTTVRKK